MHPESDLSPQEAVEKKQRKWRSLSNRDAAIWAEERPWPVKALTALLFIQGLGLIITGLVSINFDNSLAEILGQSFFYVLLPLLGLGAWVATVGFLSLRPGAWVIAMLVQALCLLLALIVYFVTATDNIFLYAMLLYCVVMVVYLNYAEVPAVFRSYPDVVAPPRVHPDE